MPIIKTENGYIYKKNTKRTSLKHSFFLIGLFLICICVLVGSFFIFSKVDITSALNLNRYLVFEEKTYYAVSLQSGESFSEVSSEVNEVKLKDGAGFVLQREKKYYLIASCYSSAEDAQQVCSQIDSYDAHVVEIRFDRLIISSNFDMNQILLIKDSLNMVNKIFESLYNIVNMLDRGEILNAEAQQKIQIFKETCREHKESFAKCFQNNFENIITRVKIFQSETISSLTMLSGSQNLSSDIKYAIMNNFYSFASLQNQLLK